MPIPSLLAIASGTTGAYRMLPELAPRTFEDRVVSDTPLPARRAGAVGNGVRPRDSSVKAVARQGNREVAETGRGVGATSHRAPRPCSHARSALPIPSDWHAPALRAGAVLRRRPEVTPERLIERRCDVDHHADSEVPGYGMTAVTSASMRIPGSKRMSTPMSANGGVGRSNSWAA